MDDSHDPLHPLHEISNTAASSGTPSSDTCKVAAIDYDDVVSSSAKENQLAIASEIVPDEIISTPLNVSTPTSHQGNITPLRLPRFVTNLLERKKSSSMAETSVRTNDPTPS